MNEKKGRAIAALVGDRRADLYAPARVAADHFLAGIPGALGRQERLSLELRLASSFLPGGARQSLSTLAPEQASVK